MDTHPYNAPLAFVQPTSDMQIKVSMFVDHNGKIYLPYLHEWNPVSDLVKNEFFFKKGENKQLNNTEKGDHFERSSSPNTNLPMILILISTSISFHVFSGIVRFTRPHPGDDCYIWRYAASLCETKRTSHAVPNTT